MGGLEQVLIRLLNATDRKRFCPVVVALDEPGELALELLRIDVPVVVVPRRRTGVDARLASRLADRLHREGVRLIHTHNMAPHFYASLAAQLMAIRWGHRPLVIHTKHGRDEPHVFRTVLLNRISSALCDFIVAVSDDAASVAVRLEWARSRKVTTILNGVSTDDFRPALDPRPARVRLGLPPDGIHVGCVARLAKVKDHRTLLDAFGQFRQGRPDAHLTLVGDGDERAELEARARAADVNGAVTFLGSRNDIAAVLSAFDIFALSSRSEGVSLTLLEAAAVGLPIVATRVGGNAEVVMDGRTGVLVPPGDPGAFAAALERIAARPDRQRMGIAGRERVIANFSVERMARAYQERYEALLRGYG
jgi:glycosyltransferase involved in cell wall biosynthesis